MDLTVLGLELAKNRRRAGLTQFQVARLMGSSQPAIARAESGAARPSLDFLERFVEATQIPLRIELPVTEPRGRTVAERRHRIRTILGDASFNPWMRHPTKLEQRALEAAGLSRESFEGKRTTR